MLSPAKTKSLSCKQVPQAMRWFSLCFFPSIIASIAAAALGQNSRAQPSDADQIKGSLSNAPLICSALKKWFIVAVQIAGSPLLRVRWVCFYGACSPIRRKVAENEIHGTLGKTNT